MAQAGFSRTASGRWYPQAQYPQSQYPHTQYPQVPAAASMSTGALAYGPPHAQAPLWVPVPVQQQQELMGNQMQKPMPPFGSIYAGGPGSPGSPCSCVVGQPGMCDSCTAQPGTCCGDGPLDPYCCGPPNPQECTSCCANYCDWTLMAMIFFSILSVIGFGIVAGMHESDDLFKVFKVRSVDDLQLAIAPLIGSPHGGCTRYTLPTISSQICMESNLNAQTFLIQIASWNLERFILYFLAMILTIVATVYAILVSCYRRKVMIARAGALRQQQQLASDKGSPRRGDNVEDKIPPQPPMTPPQGDAMPPLEVYGTPFYEFMRIAWFTTGVFALVYTLIFMWSFCSFLCFYKHSSKGELHTFWMAYGKRHWISVLCVTIYLAWPLVNIFVEFVLWIVFVLPWLVFRSLCKSGIGNLRPALPLDKMPGWIRLDMFFVDFNDIKRLGFSGPAWEILTGTSEPYCPCGDDPSIDRDPNMTAFNQYRQDWFARMRGVYPMHMMSPQQSPTASPMPNSSTGDVSPHHSPTRQRRSRRHSRARRESGSDGDEEDDAGNRNSPIHHAGTAETPRQRGHSDSRTRHRHRSKNPTRGGADDGGESNGDGSRQRHHRHSSAGRRGHRSRRESVSGSPRTTSRTNGGFNTTAVPMPRQTSGSNLNEGPRATDIDKILHEL